MKHTDPFQARHDLPEQIGRAWNVEQIQAFFPDNNTAPLASWEKPVTLKALTLSMAHKKKSAFLHFEEHFIVAENFVMTSASTESYGTPCYIVSHFEQDPVPSLILDRENQNRLLLFGNSEAIRLLLVRNNACRELRPDVDRSSPRCQPWKLKD